jgi:hypothetical protein
MSIHATLSSAHNWQSPSMGNKLLERASFRCTKFPMRFELRLLPKHLDNSDAMYTFAVSDATGLRQSVVFEYWHSGPQLFVISVQIKPSGTHWARPTMMLRTPVTGINFERICLDQ